MKKLTLFMILIMIVSVGYLQAQNEQSITKVGKKYYQNGYQIKFSTLKGILEQDPNSNPDFNKYRTTAGFGNTFILLGSGVALVGSVINLKSSIKQVNSLNQGKISSSTNTLGFSAVGLGLMLVGLPFSLSSKKHLNNAIEAYNTGQRKPTSNLTSFEIYPAYCGLGIRLRF